MNEQRSLADRHPFRLLLQVPVPWVFVLTYLLGAVAERTMPFPLHLEAAPGLSPAGWLLCGTGAAIAGWGLLTFHRARTTTVPGEISSRLVTWGPYRFTRNPMYVGLTLVYLGEAGGLRHGWPVLLLPLVLAYVHRVVIPLEEGKLVEVFGEEYRRYQEAVRRWL